MKILNHISRIKKYDKKKINHVNPIKHAMGLNIYAIWAKQTNMDHKDVHDVLRIW
ncbi:hypothetical protein PAHAL_5G225500 [Panicum hallii]|uniref:Uncharacterized protein n=1 Tax=Panicum hallii TaxID=206008 RepID=A0A2S3HTG9_9POAL|nr:hypothetical protein PAHAL_5G225500 [Panicum hallii]